MKESELNHVREKLEAELQSLEESLADFEWELRESGHRHLNTAEPWEIWTGL